MKIFRFMLPLCLLCATAFTPLVASEGGEAPVKAELVAKSQSIQPGQPFMVGIKLDMQPGWDTYWLNPGDSGFPTQVNWELPAGFTAGPLVWPYPERFSSESLVGFGYTDTTLLLTEITPPQKLEVGSDVEIKANVTWLACNESCVPGDADLSLGLPVTQSAPQINQLYARDFADIEALLPKAAAQAFSFFDIETIKEEIVLHFKPAMDVFHEIEELLFIPEEGQIVDYNAPQKVHKGENGEFVLNIKRADAAQAMPDQIKGVLLVSEKGTTVKKAIQIDTSLGATSGSSFYANIWIALACAFLGGLILNVMPCVLPVIALKIFGFVKMANQKRSVVIKHGVVFSIGVLLSFWVLSGALLLMRAYGQGVGWGFQLQEPLFVAVMTIIIFLLGLSLFGLFEFGTSMIALGSKAESKSSSPLMSSFLSGILATLVATPCTGPMLGPAVGFAMTLSTVKALGIFTFVGLGMASPYLFFSCFPKFVRFLPKPGAWMVVFKQLMGFVMMITALWLLWVFAAQTGMIALFIFLAALIVMAVAAWIYGRWSTLVHKKSTRRIATTVAVLMIAFSGYFSLKAAKQGQALAALEQQQEGRHVYSPEAIEQLRKEGKAVFVDFTAKWCLICQANKIVLHSSEIRRAFEERGVVFVEADWTNKDRVITEELQKLGRSGVPVYALYPADQNERPMILPQTLTSKVVKEYLGKLEVPTTTVYVD